MSDIDQIKDRLDIVDIVSQYVPLKKAGRTFKAPCPFHSERTPSFIVSPERQTWHCFGACGTGGDVFSFVEKKEGLEFLEVLQLLAQKAGVQLSSGRRKGPDRAADIYLVNQKAADYFHKRLLSSSEAESVRAYLSERGLNADTVKHFQLGFSPPMGHALLNHLKGEGYTSEAITKAGLVTKQDTGEIRDQFRGRLMFPIWDERGRIVGFGGRALGDTAPKYINSPQTEVFDKSAILYGVDKAKGAARSSGRLVVMEGYMDVLTAHQHGFTNAVASMGTALTEKQVSALKRIANHVFMAMDADSAGQEATLRSLKSSWDILARKVHQMRGSRRQRFLEGSPLLTLAIVLLPEGKDPDDVIKKSHKDWEDLLEGAQPVIDYLMEKEVSRTNLNSPGAKTAILEEFAPLLVTLDFFEQDSYIQKLALLLKVRDDRIKQALEDIRRQKARTSYQSYRTQDTIDTNDQAEAGDRLDEYVLSALIKRPDLKASVDKLEPEDFRGRENREIFVSYLRNSDPDTLRKTLPDILLDQLEALASIEIPEEPDERLRQALYKCVLRMKERRLKGLKLEEEAAFSQQGGQGDEVSAIKERALKVNAQLRELFEQEQKVHN